MKILYDQVSPEYTYPLSKSEVKLILRNIHEDIVKKIIHIRFGCNWATTLEARMVPKGTRYDIRVNFCLKDNYSIYLYDDKKYIERINYFNGEIDYINRIVKWGKLEAKRYSAFLLFHEIGHMAYVDQYGVTDKWSKSSNKEESWCDNWAINEVKKIDNNIMQRHLTTG